jgi:hypothetical protein
MRTLTFTFLLLSILTTGCQDGKKANPTDKPVESEITEFKPVEQGKDYISEKPAKSYEPIVANDVEEKRRIKDGTYIADVEYFNTTTGANVTFVTNVMVKDGYLEVIKWPNGVWLASGYFKPQRIRQDGTCIVVNIEAGYENRVRILNLEYY